jgi:hypothetical protein
MLKKKTTIIIIIIIVIIIMIILVIIIILIIVIIIVIIIIIKNNNNNIKGLLDNGTIKVRTMVIPDLWIEAGPQKDQYDIAELNDVHIVKKVETIVNSIKNYRLIVVLII